MKKFLIVIVMFLGINVYATSLKDLSIDIYIKEDGSAHIKEIWKANVTSNSKPTEGYKQIFNLGNSSISNFKVSMNGKEFTMVDDWDPDASFSEKMYKGGINHVEEGEEICFGLTVKGDNTYVLEYDVSNIVNNVKDAQVMYWAIIPQKFSISVDKVYVKIHSDFDYADTLDVWGYGYNGYAYVYDGYIEMSPKNSLKFDEYMVVLIKFPEKTFNTSSTIDNDFNYYLELAKEGSSPYKKPFWERVRDFLIGFGTVIFSFVIFVVVIVSAAKSGNKVGTKTLNYKNAEKKLPSDKEINAFRDIPCKKDIYRAYWVANAFGLVKNKTDFLGTLLLKWINENKIETKMVTSKILKKESKAVVFKEGLSFDNPKEEAIYNMMKKASGDNVLEKDEFKKYCDTHYKEILGWFDEIMDFESDELVKDGGLTLEDVKTFGFTTKQYMVCPKMREEAIELKGLKKFLNEFTNIKDKSAIEVKLLNEYLMYAQLFGIADKVAKEFKRLYPDVINDMTYDDVMFVTYISHTGVSAASSAKSRAESYSSGGGGFSSFGGGGGSFGGGGGGGFR